MSKYQYYEFQKVDVNEILFRPHAGNRNRRYNNQLEAESNEGMKYGNQKKWFTTLQQRTDRLVYRRSANRSVKLWIGWKR